MNPVYLDYNATAPLHPAALEAMQKWLGTPHNPSSIHRLGQQARATVEKSRRAIAENLQVDPTGILFTSSGTEANNQALRCTGADQLFVSAIEHAAVLECAKQCGIPYHVIPVTSEGIIDLNALERTLEEHPSRAPLVSIMLANNETGIIQPVAEVADIAHKHGAMLHSDAAQAFGKIPVSVPELGVDMLTISAHKCGGPIGVAALVSNGCFPITPLHIGGGQERNVRGGTENVPAIAGFGALMAVLSDIFSHLQRVSNWRDATEREIQQLCPESLVIGQQMPRLPQTSCLTMPGVENATQLMHCDLAGIAVSSGSACTSGKVESSHVLMAMGLSATMTNTALRISGGWNSKEEDFKMMLESWKTLYLRKRQ